jgi:cytochrome d ubiquinol oxidase subunit I
LFLWWRRRLDGTRWFLRVLLWALPLPWLANFLGWITTEMGRQPWIVYGLLRVEDAVSPNTFGEVLAGLIGLWAVYLLLIGLDIYLLTVTARAGVHHVPDAQISAAPAPNYAGAGFRGEDHRGEDYGSDAR